MWPRSAAQCGPGSEAQQSLEQLCRAYHAGEVWPAPTTGGTALRAQRGHVTGRAASPARLALHNGGLQSQSHHTQLTHFRSTRSRKPRPPAPTILHRIGQFLQHQSAGLQHFRAGLGWHLCCCLGPSLAPMLLWCWLRTSGHWTVPL